MIRHPRPAEAAVVAVVSLGLLLSGCSGSSNDGAAPTDTSPSASTSSDPGESGPAIPQHLAEGATTALAPGTYQFSVNSTTDEETPDALIEVPNGFDDEAEWYVVSHDRQQFLGLSTVGYVEGDACHPRTSEQITPGLSVQDLADALVAQKSTRASVPDPVTLAGYQGLYVELGSPRDISKCGQNPGLWGGRGIYGDGQIDLVWILDVDGQRLVVNASYGPSSTALERKQLTSMVDSLEFVTARR